MIFNPPFIRRLVAPGEPVTSQGWNDLTAGIAQVHEYLESTEAVPLRVAVNAADIDPAAIQVTASTDAGLSYLAVPPVPPATHHVFSGLRPGNYMLRITAPGFATTTQAATVPAQAPVAVSLTRNAAVMPQAFGQTLHDALRALGDRSIAASRVIDVMGRDVAVANPGAEDLQAAVLFQVPAAGTPMPPGTQAQLVISVSLVSQPTVEMPELTGLTLAEAQKALERLGLVLGRTETRRRVGG
jgi:hypothetical protein